MSGQAGSSKSLGIEKKSRNYKLLLWGLFFVFAICSFFIHFNSYSVIIHIVILVLCFPIAGAISRPFLKFPCPHCGKNMGADSLKALTCEFCSKEFEP
jgi:hypothetical protein